MNDEPFEPAELEKVYQLTRTTAARAGVLVSRELFAACPLQVSLTLAGVRKLLELGIQIHTAGALIPVPGAKPVPPLVDGNGRPQ